MSDYSNLNLGRPLNEASHTTIPGDHSSGLGGHSSSGLGGSAPLNAGTAAPGDYKSSGADQGFARDVLNTLDNRTSHAGTGAGFGGQQHGQQTVSGQYETTNPASGIQRSGESEPHGLRSGGHAHANFPAESDTLTSGEAGQFGSENDARRQEGLVGAATGHHHQSSHQHASGLTGGHTGPSSREMDQELNDPKRGLPDLVGHPVSSGYGLNKGHRGDESSHSHSGAGLAGAGALGGAGALAGAGLAQGHHSDPTVGHGGASGLQGGARPAHDSILNTNEKPKELEIGGFNPKGAALDVDPTVHEPKEVERISSGSGPHALVWDEASNKYVHRRELEGNTLREPTRQ